nr:MMPL family transporter [Moritella viscosa]SHO01717.1 Exporter of the RND superfamily [Moritella viscosa]
MEVIKTSLLINFVIKRPKLTICLFTCLIFVSIFGTLNLSFTSDFRSYFSLDNPQLKTFEQLETDFNKQDTLTFLVESSNNNPSIYQAEIIHYLELLTDEAWAIPYSRRVDSLINFQKMSVDEDDLQINDLVPGNGHLTPSFLLELKQYAETQPRLLNNLVSVDGTLAIVQVTLTLPESNEAATPELISYARNKLEEISNSNVKVQLFGTSVINIALMEAVERDMALLIPSSYLLIFAAIYFLSCSISGATLSLGVTLMTVLSVFGIFGWQAHQLTPVVGAVPSMIMVIVVADCMHLLVSYQYYIRQGLKQESAIREALTANIKPIVITSVTTAIGLLCLNFSESPPYRDLGNLVALGAIIACILSLTWFPAVLLLLPEPKKLPNIDNGWLHSIIMKFSQLLTTHTKLLWLFTFVLLLAGGFGATKLELNDQWHQYYDETFDVRQAIETQNDKLNGVNFIQYSVASGGELGILTPEYQKDLDKLIQWVRTQNNVGYVDGFSLQVKELSQKLNQDNPDFYQVPNSKNAIAQSVLLYEMSLPYGMGVDEQVNFDKSATRLTINLHKISSKELSAFDLKLTTWAAENTPTLLLTEGSGVDMIFAKISDRNSESLLKGTALALILISVLLSFLLRSWKLGLISIIPNIIPIMMAYGIWGLMDGHIDLGLSIVASVGLGLVVDDTVHFLFKYRHAKQNNMATTEAVEYAFNIVGIAIIITSIVLTLGFGLLTLSHFSPTYGMGALLALTVMLAAVIDFILLPLLLLKFDK